jgi:hypothetical protein
MNCSDYSARLQDYVDHELGSAETRTFEAHLAGCASCRAQLEALKNLLAQSRRLPQTVTPQRDLWPEIQSELVERQPEGGDASATARSKPSSTGAASQISFWRWLAPWAVAASVAFFATSAERRLVPRTPAWSVAAVAGAPRVGARTISDAAEFHVGQWLETDAVSRAKVAVGSIGEVNVEPNSRLRLMGVAATDHRLELARGTLSAFINAPPRIFFVDTPSATAVDLGCAYTLTVNDAGDGELRVTSGYVALEDHGRDAIIRLGMMCYTRRGVGPGTPFAEDAPEELRTALTRFDFEPQAAARALPEILTHARREDADTLWHLLSRTADAQRGKVFDALAKHVPPPLSVTRDGILAGSPAMLRAWASELGLDR